jgi:hypothetical protein
MFGNEAIAKQMISHLAANQRFLLKKPLVYSRTGFGEGCAIHAWDVVRARQ